MRTVRAASQALRLASEQHPYVCRSCARQFHTSSPKYASSSENKPWYTKLQDQIFGKKDDKAEASRVEKTKKKIETQGTRGVVQKKRDKDGREYVIADLVDTQLHKDYKEAKTWDGLEVIGSEAWVRKRADNGEVYRGFFTRKQTQLTPLELRNVLHTVLVEILALENAGRDVMEVCNPRKEPNEARAAGVKISADHGLPSLDLQDSDRTAILQGIEPVREESSEDLNEDRLLLELKSATTPVNLLDENVAGVPWMQIQLKDANMKLAVVKRIMQLTGKRIPDPVLSKADTLEEIYNAFNVKEKPKRLNVDPRMHELETVGNVKVYPNTRTMKQKEQEIGRWKLIEEELAIRDLPVQGTRYPKARIVHK